MKVYQLVWKIVREFGLFGDTDANVARFATDRIRDALLDQYAPEIRDRFTQMINHKAGTLVIPTLDVRAEGMGPIDGENLKFDTVYGKNNIPSVEERTGS